MMLDTLNDVKANLKDEMRASRIILADKALNTETRHVAFGRANLAEQVLLVLGEDVNVTQVIP